MKTKKSRTTQGNFLTMSFGLVIILCLCLVVIMQNCGTKAITTKAPIEEVKAEYAKLTPVELKCDLSNLSVTDKKVLIRLIEASKIIDSLFLLQVSRDNPLILAELKESKDPNDQIYLDMFNVMFGPWNELDANKPFLNDKPKPLGAGFYPEDMTKEEFQDFITKNPDKKEALEGGFTVVKREKDQLVAVPYHEEYPEMVNRVVELLKSAAELTSDASLKKYLQIRAEDFLTDNYFNSDMAWLDLNGNLEIVIGPYEVYEDALFSYKTAYESFICVVDHVESQKLATVADYLIDMQSNLPMPAEYKKSSRGLSSPIKVVQEAFSAGDTKAGIQTTAFNLPNDEKVREAKGSKKVMLKNIAEAKYEKCWVPIVNLILAEKPLKNVTFEAYFNHVLMHEISHGLGPGMITLSDGTQTTVSKELKDLYPTIEECKADVLGIYEYVFLMNKNVFPKDQKYSAFASYLGGMFRSIRFGIDEAHGGGVAIQFNYFIEKGAFIVDGKGKLDLDEKKLDAAITSLAEQLLIIEAKGDYAAAKSLIDKYRVMTPLMSQIIEKLKHLPVDIRPIYPEIN